MAQQSWYDPWKVIADPATLSLFPGFSGESSSLLSARPTLRGDEIPADFSIGVVFGQSGSGKSQLLQDIRADIAYRSAKVGGTGRHVDGGQGEVLALREALANERGKAVVSVVQDYLGGGEGAGLNRLSCVGLNKVGVLRGFS